MRRSASLSLSSPSSGRRNKILGVSAETSDPIEELFARGVTDGLPVVPPTAGGVGPTVAAGGRGGDELIGVVAPANGRATVERVAVNAVMAGCRPEYIPVVIAAVSAICDPEFSLVGVSGTTDAVTPLVIVNGPVRRALEVNCAASMFGAGFRANATIGRAVRLVWVNVGGARPGVISMSTFGQPGRYSYRIGEYEEARPREPLSVEHGFGAADSTVAVLAAEAPQIVVNAAGRTARDILSTVTRAGAVIASPDLAPLGDTLLVIAPEHAATIAADGWSKADVRRFVWDECRIVIDGAGAPKFSQPER